MKGDALRFARWIATAAGIGHVPLAPGTAASAAAAASGALLLHQGHAWLGLAAAGASVLGLGAAAALPDIAEDPGTVVIDEVAGQWVALLGLAAPSVPGVLAAFALFRAFDIAKPGPVGWADRKRGAAGVMGDDIIAGGLAAATLLAARAILR